MLVVDEWFSESPQSRWGSRRFVLVIGIVSFRLYCKCSVIPLAAEIQESNLACYEAQMGSLNRAKAHLNRATEIDAKFRLMALRDLDLEPLWASLAKDTAWRLSTFGHRGSSAAPGSRLRPQASNQLLQRPMQSVRRSTMRANASEGMPVKCTYTTTTVQPSSAASSSTVAASILKSPAIKKTHYTHHEKPALRWRRQLISRWRWCCRSLRAEESLPVS